jgi:hypothetical protein
MPILNVTDVHPWLARLLAYRERRYEQWQALPAGEKT